MLTYIHGKLGTHDPRQREESGTSGNIPLFILVSYFGRGSVIKVPASSPPKITFCQGSILHHTVTDQRKGLITTRLPMVCVRLRTKVP